MKIKSRKEARKEQRQKKKLRKHEYFQRKKNTFKKEKLFNESVNKKTTVKGDSGDKKASRNVKLVTSSFKHKSKHKNISGKELTTPQDRIEYVRQREKKEREKLDREIEKTRIEKLKADNEKEEIEIQKLEKQMKLKNGKSKAFILDGLDYLLDLCDSKTPKNNLQKTFEESDSEFDSDFENIVGKPKSKRKKLEKHNIKKHDEMNKNDENSKEKGSEGDSNNEDSYDSDIVDSDGEYSDDKCEVESLSDNNLVDSGDEDIKSKIENDSSEPNDGDEIGENLKKNIITNNKEVKKLHGTKISQAKKIDGDNLENFDLDEDKDSNQSDVETNRDDIPVKNEGNKKLWEDIYGRTRDEKGNVVNTYMPPHLRKKNDDVSEKNNESMLKLKRQVKGLLNRLAESNMAYISNQIEHLYMSNSRNDMNKTLFMLFQDSLFTKILTPERLISEHAMLIVILQANVGSEIGAYFLQYAVLEFIKALESNSSVDDKTINNLLIFIMHLYNFQMFHCKLMYDIIHKLLENLQEKQIELILLALKTVGFSLRKNDPLALKKMILYVQEQVNKLTGKEDNSRVKFMLEMLMAIKNNNVSKIPNYNPELVEKMRKNLKIFVRKGNYNTELSITLQDLLNAEKNGRWWIVGSAWSGPVPQSETNKSGSSGSSNLTKTPKFSKKLLELARKQRMNTDVRRNIFCVVMSSEDYLEAFEKLVKLKLKGSTEREIINVILHCVLQEKSSNPYYMHLANKFCQFDRKYQMMLQCAVWDKINELNELMSVQVTNFAKFLGKIIVSRGLPISVLKVIEFSQLEKRSVKFMRQILLTILLDKDETAAAAVFKRISDSPKLKIFRESLRLFLQHFVLKNAKSVKDEGFAKLTERVKMCDETLASFDGWN